MIAASLLLLACVSLGQGPDAGLPIVEPADLTRDPDLIGREVVVDDRIRFFQGHKGARGQVFDELILKRTDVVFKLPPALRPERPPRQPVARISGILQREGKLYTCDVTAMELFGPDLDRLDREVKRLAPSDAAGRSAWAAWAERRGRDFKDADLTERARSIEAEALAIEVARPKSDDLALSRRARARGLPTLADALLHRSFRARLALAHSADALAALAAEVQSALPRSADPNQGSEVETWKASVLADPVAAYPKAPDRVRAGLDRSLLADVLQRRLERKLADAPSEVAALADEARSTIPDRPDVARRLREKALAASEGRVAGMRLSEAEALAKSFRDEGEADRSRGVLKNWLDDQRRRLNPSDAEGQVILAGQYSRLIEDRSTAAELLRDALKADPESKSAADSFRRLGFRKSAEGGWIDPADATAGLGQSESIVSTPPTSESLKGMTMAQVKARLGGKPDRIARSATQDATIEQWTYQGTRGTRVINFLRPRGNGRPEVVAAYTLP